VSNADRQRADRRRQAAAAALHRRLWEGVFWASLAGDSLAQQCSMACRSPVEVLKWLVEHFEALGKQTKRDMSFGELDELVGWMHE
jgi:hypothetical protein